MTKNIDTKTEEKEEDIKEVSKSEQRRVAIMKEAENTEPQIVTSEKTIDFPSLNWGINKGEQRQLPVEASAQAIILANENITVIK